MRALVLGGTRFLGRAIVDALLEADHEPTLFNRGLTQPELFPDVEKLRGDRSADLSALEGREWDAVLDVAAYFPHEVRRSVEALRGRVGRYVFVSSVSVYADHSVPQAEGDAVAELARGDETDDGPETYGARKAACERIVVEEFGDAALVVRPGLIVGPHDPTGRFTYWPHRVARGGEVLAPASPDYAVQFIDVRDLAAWIVRSAADGVGGTFNATGETMPLGDLLSECIRVTGSDARLVWVPSDELLAAGAEEWMGVPLWIVSPGWEAVNRVPVTRAVKAGLTFRPLADTIRGALFDAETVDGVGLTPERERELLATSG
jgi:2'-hydroxyisoflavone reductase